MIVVTGACGFIGSCLIKKLNDENFNRIVAVDDFSNDTKNRNIEGKRISLKIHRNEFADWLKNNGRNVEFIFHLGAKTDTTFQDKKLLKELNTDYTKRIWTLCIAHQIPLIYASSAATYGDGEWGYDDDEALIPKLRPLNLYGESKQNFDVWALEQTEKPFYWAGLKFFNVYGPNEYHKGRMASVVYHAHQQIKENGFLRLFRSHHPSYADGEQLRDFIYVEDVVEVMYWMMHHRKNSGIYNLGTGQARTFLSLGKAVFSALGISENIQFIDTPIDIRDKYQYYTQAETSKLRSIGYDQPFTTLESGIDHYVSNFLKSDSIN